MYNETAATRKASIHDFFLANTMHDFLYSICGTKCERFSPCNSIRKAAISHAKQKRQGFHPYRLTFIFSQRRRHGCHRAFSLLESVHRIISPASKPIRKAATSYEKQSGRASTIPLDVYFFPTQTARLPQGVFSTRICASNRSANADT